MRLGHDIILSGRLVLQFIIILSCNSSCIVLLLPPCAVCRRPAFFFAHALYFIICCLDCLRMQHCSSKHDCRAGSMLEHRQACVIASILFGDTLQVNMCSLPLKSCAHWHEEGWLRLLYPRNSPFIEPCPPQLLERGTEPFLTFTFTQFTGISIYDDSQGKSGA